MPMLTLFTPTHDPRFLPRLAVSIAKQTAKNFEWLIVPNGGWPFDVQELKRLAPNVRVLPYYGATQNIGELKAFCCYHAAGDVLVEVDHDDELMPNCVARLSDEFAKDDADFIYSNFIGVRGREPVTYDARYGWEYRDAEHDGLKLKECVAFPPLPTSFSRIWYAPNHVRAWRTSFYDSVGGHNPGMAVLDDQDLMCRSYIEGRVRHLDECLYVYHHHQDNTCKGPRNGEIQEQTLRLHDEYIYRLAERWCDINGLRKIDLCGGFGCPPGYESVDKRGGKIKANLDCKWPFENGTVGLIRAHDALEHLRDPMHTMSEAWRVLAPGGLFLTKTPSTDGRGAWQDPTHVSFWNRNSFFYYTRPEQARYIRFPHLFHEVRAKDYFPSAWHEENNCPYVKADLMKPLPRTPGYCPNGQQTQAG